MCSTYCSFASAQSRSDDRDNEKKKKKNGKARGGKNDGTCLCLGVLAWTRRYVMPFELCMRHCLGCFTFLNLSGLHGDLV